MSRSLLVVADDDDVGVAADDTHCILDRLAFDRGENSRAFSVEMTLPPRLDMAVSNERRVRVDGS